MTFLLDHELALVRHALGCRDRYNRRALEGYRNHAVTSDGSKDDIVWQSLVTRGLAVACPFIFDQRGTSTLYFVTREGARLAGLSEAAIVRACGTREEQAKQRAKYQRDRERRAERYWRNVRMAALVIGGAR